MHVRYSARAGEHLFGGWSIFRADVHDLIVRDEIVDRWHDYSGNRRTSCSLGHAVIDEFYARGLALIGFPFPYFSAVGSQRNADQRPQHDNHGLALRVFG
jgi:hypothetical protein